MPRKAKATKKEETPKAIETLTLKNRFKEIIKIDDMKNYTIVTREGRQFIKIGSVCIDKKLFA